MINVKDAPYNAIGNGQTDDTAAIQAAINYAKSLTSPGGGSYRISVYFPAGYYYISSPINLTNANGIWLQGDGGSYTNTGIVGNTSGPIFDFSGSTFSGCENFFFLSSAGFGTTRSTIGVQFARTNNGGYNCGIRHCSFQMEDYATANNNFGTIGILNVAAEEFYVDQCVVRANAPIVMGFATTIAGIGTSYTASSRYQTLISGSMGVTNIASTSLHSYEKRQPALILNGTNSLNFQGYISRLSDSSGANETAILCSNYTTNLNIRATIESFSRVLSAINGGFEGNELNIVAANAALPTTELINITGCVVKDLKARITLPVPSERNNRYVLYHAPSTDPNQPASGSIINSEITCFDIASNQYIVSPNLLKRTTNVVFKTSKPFEKRSGRIRLLSHNYITAGSVGSATSAIILTFLQADILESPNGRAGYYRVWIDGIIRAGGMDQEVMRYFHFKHRHLLLKIMLAKWLYLLLQSSY
ncbi:glycosyl hydrolase family 28-related protein [Spirosoma sp. KNUC1025]|uniref:glycosyl hydrolase family 28-related protein n=1 Tax=Spirosoma sp. KNUC1025 TaxID=2894082 RepID=UPI00386825B6|nr:glycoside hydrolase family 55 protein [Spirosoma sp. KNUC1025]